MVTAFVLVGVPPRESIDLVKDLKKSPAVVEVAGVYGDADVVVKIRVEDMRELDKLIFQTIQSNRHVKTTRTYVALEDQHWER